MHRIIIPITYLIFCTGLTFGQKSGYSIGISTGFGTGTVKQSFGNSGSIETYNYFTSNANSEPVMASLGKGFGIQLNFGKTLGKKTEAGLETNLHLGAPIIAELTTISNQSYSGNYSNYETHSTTTYKNISQTQFNPYFKIKLRDTTNGPYVKYGLLVGCFGKISKEVNANTTHTYSQSPPFNSNDTTVITNTSSVTSYKGGVAIGFSTAIGFDFRISDHFKLTTEGSFNYLQWKPKYISNPNSGSYNNIDASDNTFWAYSSFKFRVGFAFLF